MKYTKCPLNITQQISKLENRGLIIANKSLVANYLTNINYYRLRAYTYPFQDNDSEEQDHHFVKKDIAFEDIIDLYCFDRRLRILIFNAIEKIEIAIRTKIVYEYSIDTNNSHWFTDETLFYNNDNYDFIIEKMQKDVERSNEDFIKHYYNKYSTPDFPPAWMTLETLSFGNLSKLYANLDNRTLPNKRIVQYFGLSNAFILENWIYALSVLRNYCAHHSRIWNRRFHVRMKLPYNTLYPFIDKVTLRTIRDNKLFALLSCIKYILNIISPESNFKNNLFDLIKNGGKLLNIKDMGFPENWLYLGVWKD